MAGTDVGGPIVSLHRPDRGCDPKQRGKPPGADFPGLTFHLATPYPRPALVDLSSFSRPELARQMAHCIWSDHHHNVGFRSYGSVGSACEVMRRFDDFLAQADAPGRIQKLQDISSADIDAFDQWAHAAWPPGSVVPFTHLTCLLKLLKGARRHGFIDPALEPRFAYVSRLHKVVECTPVDAYSPYVMEQIRSGARTAVERTRSRMAAAKLLPTSSVPLAHLSSAEEIVAHIRDVGLIWDHGGLGRRLRRGGCEQTLGELLDQVHPGLCDLVPLAILIADDCGIPPESIKELSADCLDEVDDDIGFGYISYIKRRKNEDGTLVTEPVKTKEPWSTGWLVKLVLEITETTRKQMADEGRDRLFVCRVGSKLKDVWINPLAIEAHLKRYPVEDDDGTPLDSILLTRIRKTVKSIRYQTEGGDLHRIGKDHTRQVFAKNYAPIASLQGTHEGAVRDALHAALAEALTTTVVASLEREEAEGLEGAAELWLAYCRNFHDSPYPGDTRACGAPFWGCLDCRNAVVTRDKLPSLLRLLEHLRGKLQEMSQAEFKRGFGYAFVRLQQILAQFAPQEIERARAALGDDFGPDWTLAQLAYAI